MMPGLLASLSFAAPWMLTGLAALPVIWWLLRLTPPRPETVAFPPTSLLFGLKGAREDARAQPLVAYGPSHAHRRRRDRRAGRADAEASRQPHRSRYPSRFSSSSIMAGPRQAAGPRGAPSPTSSRPWPKIAGRR